MAYALKTQCLVALRPTPEHDALQPDAGARISGLTLEPNDQKAFGHAERVADHTAEQLPGETVDSVAGEANVGLAVRDALATFPADEIVVAVRPDEEEGLVESIVTDSAPQHRLEGVPVRYVVIGD